MFSHFWQTLLFHGDGHWKSKALIFLAVLQLPVKERLQYDCEIKIVTTE